ncbi:MAG: cytochrome c3 family protein [Myxococcota bacterium]
MSVRGGALAAVLLGLTSVTCTPPEPQMTTPLGPPLGAMSRMADIAPLANLAPRIRFSHRLHGEVVTCLGCHTTVEEEDAAGTPTLEDCLDCHDGMQSTAPENVREEEKLEFYASAEREIAWKYSARLPKGLFFSHQVHVVEAEAECEDCHGEIAETDALPKKPAIPYTHTLCGDCHEVSEAVGSCRMCHPR